MLLLLWRLLLFTFELLLLALLALRAVGLSEVLRCARLAVMGPVAAPCPPLLSHSIVASTALLSLLEERDSRESVVCRGDFTASTGEKARVRGVFGCELTSGGMTRIRASPLG